ncbi:MAG: S-formylglutathione hydrolase [Chlamydiales bacterium]|jgi:S-formylglutathione hydrolase
MSVKTEKLHEISSAQCFDCTQKVYSHDSKVNNCKMTFSICLPPQHMLNPCPVLYWLSGLTCTEQNFITKAGAQQYAAKHGIIIVAPDTSPRGDHVPDDAAYDLGCGAGFYLNAGKKPWDAHYNMYDYVLLELPRIIENNFPVKKNCSSISGHSMGGHGALVLGLRNPERYRSVSAFAPICSPSQVPWGQKAFSTYLGSNQNDWKDYDACELVLKLQQPLPILIDQGSKDEFLDKQLHPYVFQESCKQSPAALTLNMRDGYDHSYFFISSFIGKHMDFHAKNLN